MSKAWKNGSTWAHRKARAEVLSANQLENGGKCTLQIEGVCTGTADTAHHTEGKGVSERMVATCRACNLHVGDPRSQDPPISGTYTRW